VCGAVEGGVVFVVRPFETVEIGRPVGSAIATELNSYMVDDNVRAIIVKVDWRTRFEHYYSSSAD
jgi:hypothetical protein